MLMPSWLDKLLWDCCRPYRRYVMRQRVVVQWTDADARRLATRLAECPAFRRDIGMEDIG